MISWDKGRIKNIKRTTRRVKKNIKSMKAKKFKANKIDRGHEIPMMTKTVPELTVKREMNIGEKAVRRRCQN